MKEEKVYIVYDHDGDLIADEVVGEKEAKRLAKSFGGYYEEQY